jgi:hypothetical protein
MALSRSAMCWIEGSLLLAATASGAGAMMMLMVGPLAAFPALSAYCAVSLLGAIERQDEETTTYSRGYFRRHARMFGSVAVAFGAAVGIVLLSRLGR